MGLFGHGQCDMALKMHLCDTVPFEDVVVATAVSSLRKDQRKVSKHFHWSFASDYSTVNWFKANALCKEKYGSHLGAIHNNASWRLSKRAAKVRPEMRGSMSTSGKKRVKDLIGWIGLTENKYLDQSNFWADGSPFNGFDWFWQHSSTNYLSTACVKENTHRIHSVTNFNNDNFYQGWQWQNCYVKQQYFLCSAVNEKWSVPVAGTGTPKYVLIQSREFALDHKRYAFWCEKHYNKKAAALHSEESYLEMTQLLIDNKLLYNESKGSGVLVFVGAKYNALSGHWQWYDGRRLKLSKKKFMRKGRILRKAGQCLAIDTWENRFVSVDCKHKVKSHVWLCTTPRLKQYRHHFRHPLRGKLCTPPWLFAILSVVVITLSLSVQLFFIRVLQYETLRESTDFELISEVFGIENQSEDELRKHTDTLLADYCNVPADVRGIIHEFCGKLTLNGWVQLQYDKWKPVVMFSKYFAIWALPTLRIGFALLSTMALMWLYVDWAEDRHSSWIRFGGFWWIFMVHPTFVKMLTTIVVTPLFGKRIAIVELDDYDILYSFYCTELVFVIAALCLAALPWICGAAAGVLVWPWLAIVGSTAVVLFIDLFTIRNPMHIVRRLQWRKQLFCLLWAFFGALLFCVAWLLIAVGGIGFFKLATGMEYLKSHSEAWVGDICDSYFDFDALDWRAWVLLIHWVFF